MGNTIIKASDSTTSSSSSFMDKLRKLKEYWVLIVFALIFVGAAIWLLHAFLVNQAWNLSWQADANLWGLYGDFIGGVFGVVVVIISTYYLIETLREQKSANEKVTKANSDIVNMTYFQQVDARFMHIAKQYEKLKNSQNHEGESLHQKVNKIINIPIRTNVNYKERNEQAYHSFDEHLYIKDREVWSVLFRLLYQQFALIDSIKETDENKEQIRTYAKLVRSQLNEDELLLLRYNCYCSYGENMKPYVNKFNLLKHTPILSLIEFQFWANSVFNEDILRNAIDTEFIRQRKIIKMYVSHSPDDKPLHDPISKRYHLTIQQNKDKTEFIYTLVCDEKVECTKPIDRALDKLLENDYMKDFLDDFMHELFEYSNFCKFNEALTYTPGKHYSKDNRTMTYSLSVASKKDPIELTYVKGNFKTPSDDVHPTKEK